MNIKSILVALMLSLISVLHADQLFDQIMAPEIKDEKIIDIENEITMLTQQLKEAQEMDNETVVRNIELRLKELFKERARQIKALEKKGFTPLINRALYTDIEWRIKGSPANN